MSFCINCTIVCILMRSPRCRNGVAKINLKSVLIGNGFTNPKLQYAYYYPTVCTNTTGTLNPSLLVLCSSLTHSASTGYGPYVSEKDCASMAAALPRCQALVQKCYDDPSNAAVCLSANQYCEATQTERCGARGSVNDGYTGDLTHAYTAGTTRLDATLTTWRSLALTPRRR